MYTNEKPYPHLGNTKALRLLEVCLEHMYEDGFKQECQSFQKSFVNGNSKFGYPITAGTAMLTHLVRSGASKKQTTIHT